MFLCHSFCEIGAVRMSDELRVVRAFLDRNPNEVLLFVIQDYVAPPQLRTLFDDAGFGDDFVTYTPGVPLPTLGTLIRDRTRLLVSLENGDGGAQLPNAFAGLVEETPFFYVRATGLRGTGSCAENRGIPGSPIFQLNHWVTPPVRQQYVPAANRLLASRAVTCGTVRGRIPTLLAVDFADRSNVVQLADPPQPQPGGPLATSTDDQGFVVNGDSGIASPYTRPPKRASRQPEVRQDGNSSNSSSRATTLAAHRRDRGCPWSDRRGRRPGIAPEYDCVGGGARGGGEPSPRSHSAPTRLLRATACATSSACRFGRPSLRPTHRSGRVSSERPAALRSTPSAVQCRGRRRGAGLVGDAGSIFTRTRCR